MAEAEDLLQGQLFGRRFVFFSSIFNDNFNESQNSYRYGPQPAITRAVDAHFNHAFQIRQVRPSEMEQYTEFEKIIDTFIRSIESLANAEYQSEIGFISQMRTRLTELHESDKINGATKTQIEELLKLLPKQDEAWDYKKLIQAFTDIQRNKSKIDDEYKSFGLHLSERQKRQQLDPEELITRAITDKETGEKVAVTKSLKEWFATNYKEYKAILASTDRRIYGFKTLIAEKVNYQATKVLKALFEDKDVMKEVSDLWAASMTGKGDFKTQLQDFVYNKAAKGGFGKYTELLKAVKADLKDTAWMTQEMPPVSQFVTTVMQSLESKVLIDQAYMAVNYVIELYNQEDGRQQLLDAYKSELSTEELDKVMQAINSGKLSRDKLRDARKQLYKMFKDIMAKRLQDNLGRSYEEVREQLRSVKNKKKQNELFLAMMNEAKIMPIVNTKIGSSIEISMIHDYDVAEFMADASNALNEVIQKAVQAKSTVYGTTIKLKNDVTWAINFQPIDSSDIQLSEEQATSIKALTDSYPNFLEDFMKAYHKNTNKDQPNVREAARIFKELAQENAELAKRALESCKNATEQLQALERYLQNQFYNSISVKSYEFYTTELGFKAGSLGKDYSAIEAINTINDMYEVGGIATLDKEKLIEAVLNAPPRGGTILMDKKSDILKNVENYLLAGALMTLFDDGFVNTEKFLGELKGIFGEVPVPNFVHLYNLNGKFYPASLLLKSVVVQLQKLKTQTETELANYSVSSSVVINNPISNEDIPIDQENWESRWTAVSQTAVSNTKLHILFAAGLLDLFQSFQTDMQNPVK